MRSLIEVHFIYISNYRWLALTAVFVSDRESKVEEGERESKEGEAAAGVATASAALPPVSISQLLEYVPSEALYSESWDSF